MVEFISLLVPTMSTTGTIHVIISTINVTISIDHVNTVTIQIIIETIHVTYYKNRSSHFRVKFMSQ